MVASEHEADVFRIRPEVQPITHCQIRSCAVYTWEDKGFGLYVARGALPPDLQEDRAGECYHMFRCKEGDPGGTKLVSKKQHYSTAQAVLNECTCKYVYEGTARHKCC